MDPAGLLDRMFIQSGAFKLKRLTDNVVLDLAMLRAIWYPPRGALYATIFGPA